MTNRQRTFRTHAVILKRRNYSDADRILTVFTPTSGKLELIAKGIRKTTSRKAGHLELLTHVSLLAAQARTWDIVTEVATVESFYHLRQDLDNIGRASYLCELVDCFTEADDENQPLWDLLLLALRELEHNSQHPETWDPQVLMRWFDLHLLSLTGFQPQLFHCIGCDEAIGPVTNYLSIQEGGILCPNCRKEQVNASSVESNPQYNNQHGVEPIEVDVLKILRFLQSHPWSEVRPLVIRPQIMLRVENILYRMLLLILEHQLKSVEVVRKLQKANSRQTVK